MVVGEGRGPSPAPRLNPLRAACFQNASPLRTLDLEQASACQKTPALQAKKIFVLCT